MIFRDFARGPGSVRLVLEFGARRGLPAGRLLAGSGIGLAQLDDPECRLLGGQELRVIGNLLRALGHPPGLGLEMGRHYTFSTFGLWGYGLLNNPTMGDALAWALRFVGLSFAYCSIRFARRGDLAVLHYAPPPGLSAALGRFVAERDMAASANLLREVGGEDFRLSAFELKAGRGRVFSRPADPPRPGGAEPSFRGAAYRLAFPAGFLARRLPHADPLTLSLCERLCREQLERQRVLPDAAQAARDYLSSSDSGTPPSLGALADALHTSERTLKRRLGRAGASFRALAAQERAALAARLVGEERDSLSRVAERMGYASLSSFSQAFRRWHGVPPSAFRRGARGDGPSGVSGSYST